MERDLVEKLVQGNELRLKKDYEGALVIYFGLLNRLPEDSELRAYIYAMISSCYFHLNRYYEAVAFIEKAVALMPEEVRWRERLAEYCWLGTLDLERAAQEVRKAIELNPNYVGALVLGAAIYGEPEEVIRLEEAIEWMERAVQLDPNNPDYYIRLGDLYRDAGRVEEAKRMWMKALLCGVPLRAESVGWVREHLLRE